MQKTKLAEWNAQNQPQEEYQPLINAMAFIQQEIAHLRADDKQPIKQLPWQHLQDTLVTLKPQFIDAQAAHLAQENLCVYVNNNEYDQRDRLRWMLNFGDEQAERRRFELTCQFLAVCRNIQNSLIKLTSNRNPLLWPTKPVISLQQLSLQSQFEMDVQTLQLEIEWAELPELIASLEQKIKEFAEVSLAHVEFRSQIASDDEACAMVTREKNWLQKHMGEKDSQKTQALDVTQTTLSIPELELQLNSAKCELLKLRYSEFPWHQEETAFHSLKPAYEKAKTEWLTAKQYFRENQDDPSSLETLGAADNAFAKIYNARWNALNKFLSIFDSYALKDLSSLRVCSAKMERSVPITTKQLKALLQWSRYKAAHHEGNTKISFYCEEAKRRASEVQKWVADMCNSHQPEDSIESLRKRFIDQDPTVLEEKIPRSGTVLGDVRIRYRCQECHSESIKNSCLPVYFKSVMNFAGECEKCEKYVPIEAAFLNPDRHDITVVSPKCTPEQLLMHLQTVANYKFVPSPRYPTYIKNAPKAPLGLSSAILASNVHEVGRLINAMNINCVVEGGMRALFFACHHSKEEVVRCLLNRGADVHAWNIDAMRAIHAAARGKNLKIVELLHANGANLNDVDDYGVTPLHYACIEGQLDICAYLIKNGADISKSTQNQRTPLHFAVRGGHVEIVKLLIDHKAPVDAENSDSETPLALAIACGNEPVCKVLREVGATQLSASAKKDLRIAELEAQLKGLSDHIKPPISLEERRYAEQVEAKIVAEAYVRKLESRVKEQEKQTEISEDRLTKFRKAATQAKVEKQTHKQAHQQYLLHSQENKRLEEENRKLIEHFKNLKEELAAISDECADEHRMTMQ